MNKLKIIPASAEEQSLKYSIKEVNKTAASRLVVYFYFMHDYSVFTYN